MGKITSLLAKIELILKHINKLNNFEKYTQKQIIEDDILCAAFEREMYIISDLVIQICEIINSNYNLGQGLSYRESIERTLQYLKFEPHTFDEFLMIAGLRNRLAHEYAEIDYSIVYDVYKNNIPELKKLIHTIEEKISK
ncbi:DUF86 domain-containing protein [Candidatus Peregrinibacteria bacterium]|jgi:uncharacterized protein YutE (UPF0331/DUF86 family)|nr:DUF86 domain-containing protein [Candidatus Peregrinibacteria bacterium]